MQVLVLSLRYLRYLFRVSLSERWFSYNCYFASADVNPELSNTKPKP